MSPATKISLLLSVGVLALSAVPAGSDDVAPPTAWPDVPIDAHMAEVLRKIGTVDPSVIPDLDIKKSERYASTPEALAPYRSVAPHKQFFLEQMQYTGPGRVLPEPEKIESVKIGFLGPITPTVSVATGGRSHEEPLGLQMLRGSRLAIEEANARGGYTDRGIPFELVVRNDNGLWGASGNEIITFAYQERVWAILGTIDGANSHIAIRVALKAEVPMINTGDTDPTFTETRIPWVARVIGDDRQQGYLLVDYLYRKLDLQRVGIIRASNRYGRFGVREIRDGSRRLGRPVVLEMAYPVGSDDFSLELERLRQAGVDAVVHWGDARDGAKILNQMRAMEMPQPFFASDRAVSDEFLEIAGENAEGVVCGFPWNPDREDRRLEIFRENFRRRFGEEPDTYAAHAYDGMNLLVWAIEAAGLNRARIRDVLAAFDRPWPGVTGDILLGATLDDIGEVYLARFERGRWLYLSREDLGLDSEVRIGYFGPDDPDHPLGGDVWLGARLAVEHANAAGGYGGVPYRLLPVWSEDPWGTGIAGVTRLAYKDRVSAIVGSIDGASTHLAEQVVARAQLPLVGTADTDVTVEQANVSWMFSTLPGDDALAHRIAGRIAGDGAGRQLALIVSTDHDSRSTAVEVTRALAATGIVPAHRFDVEPDTAADPAVIERIRSSRAVVVLAGPIDAARWVVELRRHGFELPVYGGPSMARRAFLERAGRDAEGVIFPLPCDVAGLTGPLAALFRSRYDREPDCSALQTYDATRMLIEAMATSGLERAAIRDQLGGMSYPEGHAGSIEWGPKKRNARPVFNATIREGRIHRVSAGSPVSRNREIRSLFDRPERPVAHGSCDSIRFRLSRVGW